jgi:predicted acetyltransferase
MKDNFDLKKFLKENKALENLNPVLLESNNKASKNIIEENQSSLREKIREMILTELDSNPEYADFDEMEDEYNEEETYFTHTQDLEDDVFSYSDDLDNLSEAEEEEEEETEEETEEIETEETPDNEEAALGTVAADMEGDEGELMNHLMSALKMAKGMNNEKLSTQIGNTLKFFVSEYIGGGEE